MVSSGSLKSASLLNRTRPILAKVGQRAGSVRSHRFQTCRRGGVHHRGTRRGHRASITRDCRRAFGSPRLILLLLCQEYSGSCRRALGCGCKSELSEVFIEGERGAGRFVLHQGETGAVGEAIAFVPPC